MAYINNQNYLFDIDSYDIYVNENTIVTKENPKINSMNFQFLNPYRTGVTSFINDDNLTADEIVDKLKNMEEVIGTSYLQFFFPMGDSLNSFVDKENGEKISFEVETGDWSVSRAVVEDDMISFIVSCENEFVIKNMWSVSFICDNIISYAPIGFTYVFVKFHNIVGINKDTKLFSIHKLAAKPEINKFYCDKSTVFINETATFHWNTSGAENGKLMPGDYGLDLMKTNSMKTNINKSESYILAIKNGQFSDSIYSNVYVMPPMINKFQVNVNDGTIIWDASYANSVYLEDEKVEAKGQKKMDLSKNEYLDLSCDGYKFGLKKSVYINNEDHSEIIKYEVQKKSYDKYNIYNWTWETKNLKSIQLVLFEDECKYISAETANGKFEYMSANDEVYAVLRCYKNDNTSYDVIIGKVIKDGER